MLSVHVNNQADNPVLVRHVDAPMEIFQAEGTVEIPIGVYQGAVDFGTVPDGRRLVVEQVSAIVSDFVSLPERIPPTEFALKAGTTRHFLIPVFEADSDLGDIFVVNHQMRMYASAGDAVQVAIRRRLANGGSAHLTATISGYLVAAP
jgi:hypothetical protein